MSMDSVYIGNRGGIPIVSATPTVNTSNVSITLPNHMFRFAGQKGKIVVNLTSAIGSSVTTTLPVVILVNDKQLALQNSTGAAITVADMVGILSFEFMFDKQNDILRVLSTIV